MLPSSPSGDAFLQPAAPVIDMLLKIHPRFLPILALSALVLAVSCSGGATPVATAPTVAPTTAPVPTVPPKPVATAVPATAVPTATALPVTPTAVPASPPSGKVDLNKILPAGAGRDLFVNNCTSCHSFVCSVEGQRTADHWSTVQAIHKDKVPALSEADYGTLFAYLVANFNDKTPAPELPPELAGMGCGGAQ